MTSHRVAWPLAALLFFGCSEKGGSAGAKPEPDALDQRICPTCAVRAGGETGSFETGGPVDRQPCDEVREPIAEDDDALGLSAAAVRPLLDREIETTLRWRDIGDRPLPGVEDAALTLRVETGDAFRVRSTPKDGATSAAACRDRLEVDAEVTLSAEDGSIAGRFEAVRIEPESLEYAHGWGEADLSTFTGSLDLPFDRERGAHSAILKASFAFHPDEIRGSLDVWLFYRDEQNPDRWLAGGVPLWGSFATDTCGTDARQIEPAETAGERSFSDVIEAVRARIARQNPIAADWDGSAVELTLELGETRDHCLDLRNVVGQGEREVLAARFTGDVVAHSSHERLMTQQPMDLDVHFDRSGELANVWLTLAGRSVAAEEFDDRFGLSGVELEGSDCAFLWLENLYGQNEDGDFADGQLEVAGVACETDDPTGELIPASLEFAKWCTQGTCTQTPRRWW